MKVKINLWLCPIKLQIITLNIQEKHMMKKIFILPFVVYTLMGCVSSDVKESDFSADLNRAEVTEQTIKNEQKNVDSQSQVDPKVIALLQGMGELLASSKQFSFSALTLKEQVLPTGQKLQYDANIHVDIKRPNAFLGKMSSGAKNKNLFYDGKSLTLLDLNNNFYATTEAPGNIDDTLDFVMDKYGVSMPLADFLFADINATLTENIQSGFYVALTEVNGTKAHHLAFTQENVDWQIWINAEGQPSPVKFVINYKNKTSEPQFMAFFQDWNLAPSLKTTDFNFQPSKEMVKIEFIEVDE